MNGENGEMTNTEQTSGASTGAETGTKAEAGSESSKSLLTDGLAGGEDVQKAQAGEEGGREKEGEEKEDDPSLAVPEKAEDYQVELAEGTEVDQDLLEAYRGKAHELGLNQKQFQELASLYAEKAAGGQDKFLKVQSDAVMAAGKKWAEEIQARPTFEAEKTQAQLALRQFGTPELMEYLDVSQAGSYPPIFDFVAKVGKALAEPGFHGGGGSESRSRSAADVLYPNKNK